MNNKFIDKKINNQQEIIQIILKYFSSQKKIISQNYTANNFKILKEKYPLFWTSIKDKSFFINNKIISFKQKIYEKIIINGKAYLKYNSGRQYLAFNILKKYDFTKYTLKTFVNFAIKNLKSGFSILTFLQKYFPNDYNFLINNFGNNADSNREIIFKYINNFKNFPAINGKKCKFYAFTMSFQCQHFYEFYEKLQENEKKNIYKILEIFLIKLTYNKKLKIQLKKFFPQFYQLINKKYPQYKYFFTKTYLFYYNLNHLPLCKYCRKIGKRKRKF